MSKVTRRRQVVAKELEGLDLGDPRRARRALEIAERFAAERVGTPNRELGLVRAGRRDLRDPKVEDLHEVGLAAARLDHHVLGLQVPVNDPLRVGLRERRKDLRADPV